MVKSCSVKKNAKNAPGLVRDRATEALSPIFLAATAPSPKLWASYFRFARFNTSALYYLWAWHRLSYSELRSPSLLRRRFQGSSYFDPSHKRLLHRGQHSFPKLSQTHCTFQIPQSWPWPRSACNFEKPSWPLINVRLRAEKVRFTQSDFRTYSPFTA